MPAILGVRLSPTDYDLAVQQVVSWATRRESRYVCAANIHMVMEAWDAPGFRRMINAADLVTPDGMPLVWMMRLKGGRNQTRVYGPSLMLHILEAAAREGVPVGFYGSKPDVLSALVERMQLQHSRLNVAFVFSPPFRDLTREEDEEIISRINASGARVLFVGLGCPKQERWMSTHKDRVSAVMVGVGAAFDFIAGTKSQAPMWLQNSGLEWLFRLVAEPRRLWKRYVWHNPRFVILAILDLLGAFR